jgi:hypothetical protein
MTPSATSSFQHSPVTPLGRWAVGLAATFIVLFTINSVVFMPLFQYAPEGGLRQVLLPIYGIFMMLCGLAAGPVGLLAILRQHERSWMVWLTLLPAAFVIVFLAGEFLFPH